MKPDFVIIGAQKAGSTALMRALAEHPQVHLPSGETRYFREPWFRMESPERLDVAMRTEKPDVRRRGIKSPDLLGDEPCAQRLHDVLGVMDLISILREPVDRAISAYFYYQQWGLLPLVPVETGLRSILSGEWSEQHAGGGDPRVRPLRRASHPIPCGVSRGADGALSSTMICARTSAVPRHSVLGHLGVDTAVALKPPSRLRTNEGVYSQPRLRFLQRRQRYMLRAYPGYPGKYLQPPTGFSARLMDRGDRRHRPVGACPDPGQLEAADLGATARGPVRVLPRRHHRGWRRYWAATCAAGTNATRTTSPRTPKRRRLRRPAGDPATGRPGGARTAPSAWIRPVPGRARRSSAPVRTTAPDASGSGRR